MANGCIDFDRSSFHDSKGQWQHPIKMGSVHLIGKISVFQHRPSGKEKNLSLLSTAINLCLCLSRKGRAGKKSGLQSIGCVSFQVVALSAKKTRSFELYGNC